MLRSLSIATLMIPLFLASQEISPVKLPLNKFLPDSLEINTFSLTADGTTGFLTATKDWDHQIPYLISFANDTIAERLVVLDTLYNGAISPSGKQILYAVRSSTYTTLFLTKRNADGWSQPINLTKESGITGGYFFWYTENELYFYINENNGDLVKGILINDRLKIVDRFDTLNTAHTEFSPFVAPGSAYLIYTKYVADDPNLQGLMLSRNIGTEDDPIWSESVRLPVPYGWGAFVKNDLLYYSDGISILQVPLSALGLD